MLVRLKIAALALELVWVRVPVVTAEAVLPVVDENVAPEPTASAPANAAVASGRRTILVVRTRIVTPGSIGPGRARKLGGDPVDPHNQKPTEPRTTRNPRENHTNATVRNCSGTRSHALGFETGASAPSSTSERVETARWLRRLRSNRLET